MEDQQLPKRARRRPRQVWTRFEPSHLAPQALAQVYGRLVSLPGRRREVRPLLASAAAGAPLQRGERRRECQPCS